MRPMRPTTSSPTPEHRPGGLSDRAAQQPGDWYVVHTYSGMENRVLQNLENRVSSLNMEDYIYEIIVPTEEVTEIRNGQRKQVKRTVLPGYVLVRMDLTDESWSTVRHTPSVTGFVGHSNSPVPLSWTSVRELDTAWCRGHAQQRRPDPEQEEGRVADSPSATWDGGRRAIRRRHATIPRSTQQPATQGTGRDLGPGDPGRSDLPADPESLTAGRSRAHHPRNKEPLRDACQEESRCDGQGRP